VQEQENGNMWILIWLAMNSGGSMEYYHLGTYATVEECGAQLGKAHILVTKTGETIDCLYIEVPATPN